MATYRQVKDPWTGVVVEAGWCLGLVRQSFDVPAWEARATWQANLTKYRHTERQMPNVAVPVWFWHWGTYGGVTGEFGHVVVWVPGVGFLSSPSYVKTDWLGREIKWQQWFATLEEVERTFNATYRFWTEDIGGERVVEPVAPPVVEMTPPARGRNIRKRKAMIYIYDKDSLKAKGGRRWGVFVLGQPGSWWEFQGETAGPMLEKQLGKAMGVSKAVFDDRKKTHVGN